MKFTDLDRKMRVYENTYDHSVLPGIFIVARLDGRNFTRLTKETYAFESPLDARFRDHMLDTAEHLMTCGFDVVYAYTQSDEISLLFDLAEEAYGRKERKYNSVLASEAGARLSLLLGGVAAFDCRLCLLPNTDLVVDYFRWRQEDAHRNALNAHCYWMLRRLGKTVQEATEELLGLSVSAKNELLFSNGVNFSDLPLWQRRGAGLRWETFAKLGTDPRTGAPVQSDRRRVGRDLSLPMGDAYGHYVRALLPSTEGGDRSVVPQPAT